MIEIPKWDGKLFMRGLALGGATALCAVLAGLVSLAVLHATAPDDDLAKQQSFSEILSDPFVRGGVLLWSFGTALVAYPFAFFLLVRTRLERGIPLVLLAALFGTALGPASHIKSCVFFGGLVTGLAAMLWCHFRLREVGRRSPEASASP